MDAVLSFVPQAHFRIWHEDIAVADTIFDLRRRHVLSAHSLSASHDEIRVASTNLGHICGYDATCLTTQLHAIIAWLATQASIISHLVTHSCLQSFLLIVWPPRIASDFIEHVCSAFSLRLTGWTITTFVANATDFGDPVASTRLLFVGHVSHPDRTFDLQPTYDCLQDVSLQQHLPFIHEPEHHLCIPGTATLHQQPYTKSDPRHPSITATLSGHEPTPSPFHDPLHPSFDWSLTDGGLFGPSFAVYFHPTAHTHTMYIATHNNFLALLGLPRSEIATLTPLSTPALDSICHHALPMNLACTVIDQLLATSPSSLPTSPVTQVLCLHGRPVPTDPDWRRAYADDPDTNSIITTLTSTPNYTWTKAALRRLPADYRQPLRNKLVHLRDERLVYLKPIPHNQRSLALIIVPCALRRTIFTAYHASPLAGHMDYYKTLYCLRLRFFWPKMWTSVRQLISTCAHCILSNATKRDASSLLYSFPVTKPFCMLFCDLWTPGVTSPHSKPKHYMTTMDDLTGFVIPSDMGTGPTSESIAWHFMRNVALKFGMCAAICVDDDNKFRGLFEAAANALKIRFIALAKGNHQGMRSERFHRFLNKVARLTTNNRDSSSATKPSVNIAAYAWNSAPIDGTDVVRSLPAVGRIFCFPLDIAVNKIPEPTSDCAAATVAFLNASASARNLSISILQILCEDRVTAHRERVNLSRSRDEFQVGDVVTARVQKQSNAQEGRPQKLYYSASGPYEITRELGHGAYLLWPHSKPAAATRKHHASDLFKLPPIIHDEPLDTTDLRFLDFDHSPVENPLLKDLGITGYITTWFGSKGKLRSHPPPSLPSGTKLLVPTIAELNDQMLSNTPVPTPPAPDTESTPTAAPGLLVNFTDASTLASAISASTDKLFFIAYRHPGTIRPKWHLVQADVTASHEQGTVLDGTYLVNFLVRPNRNRYLADADSRWWLEWHEIKWLNDGEFALGP